MAKYLKIIEGRTYDRFQYVIDDPRELKTRIIPVCTIKEIFLDYVEPYFCIAMDTTDDSGILLASCETHQQAEEYLEKIMKEIGGEIYEI